MRAGGGEGAAAPGTPIRQRIPPLLPADCSRRTSLLFATDRYYHSGRVTAAETAT